MDGNGFGCKLKKQVCAILYRGGGVCRLCCHQPGFNSVPRVPSISWGKHTWKHLGLCQLWGDNPGREVQGEGFQNLTRCKCNPSTQLSKASNSSRKNCLGILSPLPRRAGDPRPWMFPRVRNFNGPHCRNYPPWPSQQGTCTQLWGPRWGGSGHRAPSCDGAVWGGLRGCECSLAGFFPHQTAHPISAAAVHQHP